ncbi:MAG: C_GCAxxG_C_C family protein [Cyanobacteria bacterium SIG26]|nr:C_GCAxxG_C_C family protein [Cyanobacteria bacterium SIG26]
MKTNEQIARDNFTNGYNCAQSVFLTYAQKYGFNEEKALKLSSSFGGGMGRLREVCGAVSAMFMIAGLERGYIENNNDETKAQHYELIQKLAQEFKEENGSIICRELLGLEEGADSPIPSKRTEQYYQDRPCEEFIASACRIIDKNLK